MRPSLKNLIGKKNLIGAEIGVKFGINAKDILDNLDIKKLYLIDPFLKNKEWKKSSKKLLFNYSNKIKWLRFLSCDAVKFIKNEELDFVYIDGNHIYEFIKQDIELYYSKVKTGGLIAGHDYDEEKKNNGVIKAVKKHFRFQKINNAICDSNKKVEKVKKRENKDIVVTDWWVWK